MTKILHRIGTADSPVRDEPHLPVAMEIYSANEYW